MAKKKEAKEEFKEKKEIESLKNNKDLVSYIFGIMSIVFAIFIPLTGVVFGIIGLFQNKNQISDLSKKAKKLNIAGIILSFVLFIVSMIITAYLTSKGLSTFQTSFPA